jgi:transcriptional regulator with XRE-family HTH domain
MGGSLELPQKKLADQCRISERQLRRIENGKMPVPLPTLVRIASSLEVSVDEIAFGASGPMLVPSSSDPAPPLPPELIHIPRHTTVSLAPVIGAQALYELAEGSMELVPHVLVEAAPAQMAMIEECLSLLKAVSERKWSCGLPVASDEHDDAADFPEASRRRRLAELFVLLKGHDIRIVASREIYHYPPDATPWLNGERTCFQLVIGFAPPRGEYDEERVTVHFDGGRDITVPYKLVF